MASKLPSALRQGTIPTLFQGVSRQPDSVRFPGQVQDAENVDFSVETGGFSPRLGLRLKKKITGLATGATRKLHLINRDVNEKYRMVLSSGGIRVFDKDYNERTVNVDAGNTTWLTDDPTNFSTLTAIDYTFVTKKTQTAAMDTGTLAPAAPSMAVLYVAQGYAGDQGDWFTVTINGTKLYDFHVGSGKDPADVAEDIRATLVTGLGALWTVSRVGSYVFVKRNDNTSFTVAQSSPNGDVAMIWYKDRVTSSDKLPTLALHGMILHVQGASGDGYWVKFNADNGTSGSGQWRETVEPGDQIQFDATTMPRGLVRNGDGSFTLSTITWDTKGAGSTNDVPPPDFVGQTVMDIVFSRNRLGLISNDTLYYSKAGEYFNFWPETATDLNDADPFGLTNTTSSISKFYFGVPFRRAVFVMADNAQFEVSGSLLTPSRAAIDLATSYAASTRCRPVPVGDEMYFPAESGTTASILAYTYDDSSVSETANDVSKHVLGFIPNGIIKMAADSIRNKIFLLSENDTDALYVHSFFYQGDQRVQSAWSRYQFDGVKILSIGMLDGVVNALIEYGGAVWLAELPILPDIYSNYTWTPRLDVNQMLTGVYNAGTGKTTWTLGYTPTRPAAVTSNDFPAGKRMVSIPLTIVGSTVVASGDWSAFPVMVGETFDSYVEFSKQFLRDAQGAAIIDGVLMLKRMTLGYVDSGYFAVEVTPYSRATKTKVFNARRLGQANNLIQAFPTDSGEFSFGVNSNAQNVVIKVKSDTFLPYTIVSASWFGDFTSKSQG